MARKVRRTEKEYGVPPLTFAEGARILGVSKGELMNWVMEHMTPGEARWSKWRNEKESLPEVVIRLYLTWLRQLQPAPSQTELPQPTDAPPGRRAVPGQRRRVGQR